MPFDIFICLSIKKNEQIGSEYALMNTRTVQTLLIALEKQCLEKMRV